MKKNISLFIFLMLTTGVFAQGIKFYNGSFEDALKKAKEENKLVFVDVFTTW